ncbi:MAG TPA: ATP-binding protein [Thermoanaerobaculia bacterium]|nr:ATP-binding protein [Thermoanaerobaculia bacterium]
MHRLHGISTRPIGRDETLAALLAEVLDAALEITGRERGVIRLVDETGESLVELATRGFEADFMQSMTRIQRDSEVPSAVAWRTGRRFAVADIAADARFAGTPAGQRLLRHGVRAVQATPLVSRAGQVVGTLTTHGDTPHEWSERELRLLDMLSRDAADFIERAKAQAQLQEADRRKDEFLAILAHELRNPLAPIRNSLHILRLGARNDPTAERVTEMMERQVNHMVRLVDDLMEVSRITRGKIELRKEPVEIAAVVRSAVETSRPLIEAAGHQLTVAVPPEPLTLEGDPVRLAQVFANLLNNAAKYTDDGGRICLTVRREGGDAIAVSVRDTGTGISADMLPRVFELFTQVDRSAGRAQGGLGIGLTLVKSLVEMHGGSVEAHSEGPGRGSEFVVRLPLSAAPRRAGEPGPEERPPAILALRRVLVVDDNRDAAESLAMLLKLLGSEVHVAYDGPGALEAVTSYRPSVVLLDIGMPGMDGHEVARRIRSQPELQDVALIAITGWGQEEDRRRSHEAGFDSHLIKPVDVGALEGLLASLEGGAGGRRAARGD